MEILSGGRENAIFKRNDTVVRPLNSYSSSIHLLLQHFEKQGIEGVPRFVAIDGGNEVVTFVEGQTVNYPLLGAAASDAAVKSAGKLLRCLHDASVGFIADVSYKDQQWMLPVREPVEVMCHGDYAPYNVALVGNEVVGIFDFDTAHPAPRLWDLAYAIYCWAPFKTHVYDKLGELPDQINRAKLFCDAYGMTNSQRQQLVATMIDRLQALVDFMKQQAAEGNTQFIANLADGHHLSYLADIDYLQQNGKQIIAGLME
ncbi:phosphotransferase enzyme family protein [Photobacterium leiognathi]|uniref:phosphotransferase enzyme family protein n=1 Tax=Photobacterium leiognathi TaxID=553611 RepID=UPI0029811377|nr:aminoglycoside phosphotransferase family protein [Photobacterium leiognathi]